ncbi:MAG: potassium/proton antiporter [Lachnospiraceae bacterium]
MTTGIILTAAIIFLCILADRFSDKAGMPALILFMFIGMLFGSDGILKIPFDNYNLTETFCSIALLFIMFYGGFNTKWQSARPVAVKSVLLSTIGVVITAGITAFLCHIFLKFSIAESFLIGAVLSSTDAASVFSILRQKKLNLKDGTASLLEMESGSNDPVAYMLTVIGIGLLGAGEGGNLFYAVFAQLIYGCAIGILFALGAVWLLTKSSLIADGLDTIFMIATVLLCFGLSSLVGGNAYLSVYLMGIITGNSHIKNKNVLIPFFDGITSLAQIFLFFLLGLLAFPHRLPAIILPALAIVFFLTVIARPLSVFILLKPLKCSLRQCLLVSWAGLRGAASIVFATMVIASGVQLNSDLFHIVFMVALFSVAIQGTLLPAAARKLDMVDDTSDVRKTFNDYQEESAITLMRMFIPEGHNWENKMLRDVSVPTGSLAIMIKRNKETLIPRGDTRILAGDNVIFSVPAYEPAEHEKLEEIQIDSTHEWCNRSIEELQLPPNELIALIIRGEENLIPDGKTVILEHDIVVAYR